MRLIVAGGRNYTLTSLDVDFLDKFHLQQIELRNKITHVITGGCRGVDLDVEDWARVNFIRVIQDFHIPQWVWDEWGAKCGPIRNWHMAEYGKKYNCSVILFPGGKGTQNMYDESLKRGLHIILSPSWHT